MWKRPSATKTNAATEEDEELFLLLLGFLRGRGRGRARSFSFAVVSLLLLVFLVGFNVQPRRCTTEDLPGGQRPRLRQNRAGSKAVTGERGRNLRATKKATTTKIFLISQKTIENSRRKKKNKSNQQRRIPPSRSRALFPFPSPRYTIIYPDSFESRIRRIRARETRNEHSNRRRCR